MLFSYLFFGVTFFASRILQQAALCSRPAVFITIAAFSTLASFIVLSVSCIDVESSSNFWVRRYFRQVFSLFAGIGFEIFSICSRVIRLSPSIQFDGILRIRLDKLFCTALRPFFGFACLLFFLRRFDVNRGTVFFGLPFGIDVTRRKSTWCFRVIRAAPVLWTARSCFSLARRVVGSCWFFLRSLRCPPMRFLRFGTRPSAAWGTVLHRRFSVLCSSLSSGVGFGNGISSSLAFVRMQDCPGALSSFWVRVARLSSLCSKIPGRGFDGSSSRLLRRHILTVFSLFCRLAVYHDGAVRGRAATSIGRVCARHCGPSSAARYPTRGFPYTGSVYLASSSVVRRAL